MTRKNQGKMVESFLEEEIKYILEVEGGRKLCGRMNGKGIGTGVGLKYRTSRSGSRGIFPSSKINGSFLAGAIVYRATQKRWGGGKSYGRAANGGCADA